MTHNGHEELRSVGVGATVGHGEKVRFGVFNGELLIGKGSSIDGFAALSIS